MTKDLDEGTVAYFIGRTPMGRAGQAAEVAAVALFLCSPAASFMNGAIGKYGS
jgi:NAD(P)-dependent dehydrogenase (short-subunit alcohol dehydrogenase family)